MNYPPKEELEELFELISKYIPEDPTHENLMEMWDNINQQVNLSQYSNLLSCVCKDLFKLYAERSNSALGYILAYVSSYPASYEVIAKKIGVARPAVFNSLKKSAKEMPWLKELMILQSEAFDKVTSSKVSTVQKGTKVSDETKKKQSESIMKDWKKKKLINEIEKRSK